MHVIMMTHSRVVCVLLRTCGSQSHASHALSTDFVFFLFLFFFWHIAVLWPWITAAIIDSYTVRNSTIVLYCNWHPTFQVGNWHPALIVVALPGANLNANYCKRSS